MSVQKLAKTAQGAALIAHYAAYGRKRWAAPAHDELYAFFGFPPQASQAIHPIVTVRGPETRRG